MSDDLCSERVVCQSPRECFEENAVVAVNTSERNFRLFISSLNEASIFVRTPCVYTAVTRFRIAFVAITRAQPWIGPTGDDNVRTSVDNNV